MLHGDLELQTRLRLAAAMYAIKNMNAFIQQVCLLYVMSAILRKNDQEADMDKQKLKIELSSMLSIDFLRLVKYICTQSLVHLHSHSILQILKSIQRSRFQENEIRHFKSDCGLPSLLGKTTEEMITNAIIQLIVFTLNFTPYSGG